MDPLESATTPPTNPSNEVKSAAGTNLLQVRTYDCIISYDKHYQTPRFWLFGYDEDKKPLTPAQVFQDVPADHAFKTMTMEAFPHSGQQLASVHPCKHASVMKKFIDRMEAAQNESTGYVLEDKKDAASAKGKKWPFGGMVRKVTGGGSGDKDKAEKAKSKGDEEEQPDGVQVDFYLVIVGFLSYLDITRGSANSSSSSLSRVSCRPSRWTAPRPRLFSVPRKHAAIRFNRYFVMMNSVACCVDRVEAWHRQCGCLSELRSRRLHCLFG